MKSLILTVLYLAKDTVHRWLSRLSSPLARVLVVFFLTLAALCGMGSYAISAKIVKDKLLSRGGDSVAIHVAAPADTPHGYPTEGELRRIVNCESFHLMNVGSASDENGRIFPIYTYDFRRSGQMLPLLNNGGSPTILINPKSKLPAGPTTIQINRVPRTVAAHHLPDNHLLTRLISQRALIVQPGDVPMRRGNAVSSTFILKVNDLQSADDIRRVESYFNNYLRLDGNQFNIISAASIMDELESALDKQMQCRLAFCLGISVIVGILLTALAGIEYRQNEYIYTLMKSFGIRPMLLVAAFITENLILVGGSAVAALAVFMHSQDYIVLHLLKLGKYSITLPEIMTELHLIGITLLACVFASSIPVFFAANRDIGRVLK